jgi:hypothetical protein
MSIVEPLFKYIDAMQVDQLDMHHDSVSGDVASYLRQIPEHEHDRLKKVQINGFCSAKSIWLS